MGNKHKTTVTLFEIIFNEKLKKAPVLFPQTAVNFKIMIIFL